LGSYQVRKSGKKLTILITTIFLGVGYINSLSTVQLLY
jgi:hypothetical protein